MNNNLFSKLFEVSKKNSLDYFLHLGDHSYGLSNVSIEKSPNPVSKPTMRGGVYFSDEHSYRIKGTINDLTVLPELSKTMLGPNADFTELKITTTFPGLERPVSIYSNLTNSMHNSSKIDLNMLIVRIE